MKSSEIIKEVMKENGFSQAKLADVAGYKSQVNISGILNRNNSIKTDVFVQLLSAMECELIVRDPKTGKEWTVTDEYSRKPREDKKEV